MAAKSPKERPQIQGTPTPAPEPEPGRNPEPENARAARPATAKVSGRPVRYNPTPGYRVVVTQVNGYGEPLEKPNMKAFAPPRQRKLPDGRIEVEFDQAEYLLQLQKPRNVKPMDWWRDATSEELAAYQDDTGAFGEGPFAQELRREWLARHPEVREGAPPPPDAAEKKMMARLAEQLDKLEGGGR